MEKMTAETGDYLGTSELARILGKSEGAIRAAEAVGRLPRAGRAGNRRVWSRREIENFIAEENVAQSGDER